MEWTSINQGSYFNYSFMTGLLYSTAAINLLQLSSVVVGPVLFPGISIVRIL
jgi:hypothetical protein